MSEQPKFLLGYGERLTERIPPTRMKQKEKQYPYSFEEAKRRLLPMIKKATVVLDELPASACPHDEAVAVLTIHPQFLAKSFFPGALLREVGLEAVGSRPHCHRAVKTGHR